jgi:hypothetical protein
VIAVAEGPVADDGDCLRIQAITASIRGQKTRGGTLFGVLSGGLTLLHPQNYQVTKYYTRRRIWDDNTQKWVFRRYKILGWSKESQDRYRQ